MLNQVVLVGRLTRNISVNKSENGIKVATIPLAIPRSFKNCVSFDNIADNVKEYCKKGDIVGIKGRLQSRVIEKDKKEKEYVMDVVCEKVTFLSSKHKEDE